MLVGPVGRLGAFLRMSKKQNKQAAGCQCGAGLLRQLKLPVVCGAFLLSSILTTLSMASGPLHKLSPWSSLSLEALESTSFRKSSWIHSV